MKKRFLTVVIICSPLILAGFLFFAPIHLTVTKDLTIVMPIDQVSHQITNIQNWQNWFPGLKGKDSAVFNHINLANPVLNINSDRYTTLDTRPNAIAVEEEKGREKVYHYFILSADSFGNATKVNWTRSLTMFAWCKNKIAPSPTEEAALDGLKQFMEDPKTYFGFAFHIEPVADTLVLTKKIMTTKLNQLAGLAGIYHYLLKYAYDNNISLDSNGPRIAYIKSFNNDSTLVMGGFPITQRIQNKGGVECLEMPKNGKMLVGLYEGPYKNLDKLIAAMDQYIQIKHIQKVSSMYEKFLSKPTSIKDSTNVKIEVHQAIL
jgi:effector-binding domain-containing protein